MFSSSNQWYLAIALCAAPFALFGAIELAAMLRHRQRAALARRSKGNGTRRKRRRGDTDTLGQA